MIALALSLTVWRHPVFLAGAIGYFGHVAGDQLANRPTQPMTYFMLYRAYVGFDRARMFEKWPASVSESLHLKVPMWRHIEPRLLRLALDGSRQGQMVSCAAAQCEASAD